MSAAKVFCSGNDAVALGVRLARPALVSAYPITPQTVCVERLSEYAEDGSLDAAFMHVESEHSAMSAAIGASSAGSRVFTATSSQGLLYMAETLFYAAGGRFPVVMMNANRSLALPWSIYGDWSDSLSLLNSGWIQVYVEDAQEALDMVLQAYRVAEDPAVLTPFMINLDGFVLTHTYELVELPEQADADRYLPPFRTTNRMSLEAPKNLGFSTTPEDNTEFKIAQHRAVLAAAETAGKADEEFKAVFGRSYGGLVEAYRCADAEVVLVTLGSITGTARLVCDRLRAAGRKVGVLKLRYMRPFPAAEIRAALAGKKAVGVLDKDISFGHEGTVFTHVKSALAELACPPPAVNFVTGFGGRDVPRPEIERMFDTLLAGPAAAASGRIHFTGTRCSDVE
ncbi:MAG: hypothetical protein JNG85_07830 [Spirochaetaceae bacterium]|nr:hypothetical protein [Spirochaetaceae bacterium]